MVIFNRARPRGQRPPVPLSNNSAVDGAVLAQLLGVMQPPTHVSERTAGGLPALDFGVNLIANAVATMMASAEAYDPEGNELPRPQLLQRPNVLFGRSEFWMTMTRSLLMHGNAVAVYADYDQFGWPRQLVPVDASTVQCDTSSGFPIYRIDDHVYRYDEIFHVRRDAPIGTCWGMGVVAKFREALRGQLAGQQYGTTSMASGGVPSAVITLDTQNVTQEVAEMYQERWIERHGNGQRKPAVVPKTVGIQPLSWSPHDAEFVESQKLSVAQCAYMLGLSPSDLEAGVSGQSLTYANLTDRSLGRIVNTYAPTMALFEEALSDALPGNQTVRGNVEALLRSTTRERYELFKLGKEVGIYTEDEIRDIERRPKLADNLVPEDEL